MQQISCAARKYHAALTYRSDSQYGHPVSTGAVRLQCLTTFAPNHMTGRVVLRFADNFPKTFTDAVLCAGQQFHALQANVMLQLPADLLHSVATRYMQVQCSNSFVTDLHAAHTIASQLTKHHAKTECFWTTSMRSANPVPSTDKAFRDCCVSGYS